MSRLLFLSLCLVAALASETDPRRLSSEKLDALKTQNLQKTETTPPPPQSLLSAHEDAPLPEYEITNEGIKEVRTIDTSAAMRPAKNDYYSSAEELVLLAIHEHLDARGANTDESEGENELLNLDVQELDATPAPASPASAPTKSPAKSPAKTPAPAKSPTPPPAKPASKPAPKPTPKPTPKPSLPSLPKLPSNLPPFAPQHQNSLQCACTFVPLPSKLPPPTPVQKQPTPVQAAAEQKLRDKILKRIIHQAEPKKKKTKTAKKKKAADKKKTASKKAASPPAPAPAKAPAPATAPAKSTATAAAPVKSTATATAPAPAPAPATAPAKPTLIESEAKSQLQEPIVPPPQQVQPQPQPAPTNNHQQLADEDEVDPFYEPNTPSL